MLFRRNKSSAAPEQPAKPGGKGRPTPSRKEAQAAARARAKAPAGRSRRSGPRNPDAAKMREAMKTGEERYLPKRDKGPMRRFLRDFVDSRLSFVELLMPLLLVTLVLGYSGNERLAAIGNSMLLGTFVLVIVDMFLLRLKVRRQLIQRFPGEDYKGTTYYTITRSLQMKFLRLPKPQVKIGQPLPDTYR